MGDLNVNMLQPSNCLKEVLPIYGSKNVVVNPTCHKGDTGSLIVLVITNAPKRIQNIACLDVGLSDFHDLILFSTKQHVPKRTTRFITYRSYKKFDEKSYENDLQQIPFHGAEIFDDVDDMYFVYHKLMSDIMDEHDPLKQKRLHIAIYHI